MRTRAAAPFLVLKNERPSGVVVPVCGCAFAAVCNEASAVGDSVVMLGAVGCPVVSVRPAAWAGTASSSAATIAHAPRAEYFINRLTSTSSRPATTRFSLASSNAKLKARQDFEGVQCLG